MNSHFDVSTPKLQSAIVQRQTWWFNRETMCPAKFKYPDLITRGGCKQAGKRSSSNVTAELVTSPPK